MNTDRNRTNREDIGYIRNANDSRLTSIAASSMPLFQHPY